MSTSTGAETLSNANTTSAATGKATQVKLVLLGMSKRCKSLLLIAKKDIYIIYMYR